MARAGSRRNRPGPLLVEGDRSFCLAGQNEWLPVGDAEDWLVSCPVQLQDHSFLLLLARSDGNEELEGSPGTR